MSVVALALMMTLVASLMAPAADARTRRCRTSDQQQVCHTVWYVRESRRITFRDSVHNGRNVPLDFTCSASRTGTQTFGAHITSGASMSGEVRAGIFGGVKAEVKVETGASVSRSMTTTHGSSVTFEVGPGGTVNCDHGIVRRNVRGRTVRHYYANTQRWEWTGKAPQRERWWIMDE